MGASPIAPGCLGGNAIEAGLPARVTVCLQMA